MQVDDHLSSSVWVACNQGRVYLFVHVHFLAGCIEVGVIELPSHRCRRRGR